MSAIVESGVVAVRVESPTAQILARIDIVIKDNRRTETLYLILTVLLFIAGIVCIAVALATGQYAWSTPSAVTTGLLYFPIKEIKQTRLKNIALATAPVLIMQLPPDKAAKEIQTLLQTLYGDARR